MASSASQSTFVHTPEGDRLIQMCIAFVVIQIVMVALRTFSRKRQNTGWLSADMLVPASLLINTTMCTITIVSIKHAAAALPPPKIAENFPDVLPLYFKLDFYAMAFLYFWAVCLPKLAILDIYLHIFIASHVRWTCYAVAVTLIATSVVMTAQIATMCRPFDYLWNPQPGGKCLDLASLFFYAALPNVITDLIMLVLPLPTILRLQMSIKTKVGLCITFFTGSVGLIVCILRIVSQSEFDLGSQNNSIWVILEVGVYLCAACLLTLRPLLVYIAYQSPLGSIFSSMVRSFSRSRYQPRVHATATNHQDPSDIDDLVLQPANRFKHHTTILPTTPNEYLAPTNGIQVD